MGTFFSLLALIGGIMGLIAFDRQEKLEKRLDLLEERLSRASFEKEKTGKDEAKKSRDKKKTVNSVQSRTTKKSSEK